MVVCRCNAVSHTEIAAARRAHRPDGTIDMSDVIARCHAGGGCGACTEVVIELAARPQRICHLWRYEPEK